MVLPCIRVTYVISNIDKAIAFEWIADRLNSERIITSFILLNPGVTRLEEFLQYRQIPFKYIRFHGIREFPAAFLKTLIYLCRNRPHVVHCHLFEASLIGLAAALICGVKKRIYTRHHSTYNHQFNRKGIKYDRIINNMSTQIVAISQNVRNILINKEGARQGKLRLIHHGFDLDKFWCAEKSRLIKLQSKYHVKRHYPVIGVIARWIEWKGIQYIIPAFKELLKDYPNALLLLANANGPYKATIEELLSGIPIDNYRIIPFEEDLFTLYHLFDIYVHSPVDAQIEAFGQTYVEALAAGIPSVFTLSGVAHEFITHEQNALVVGYRDSEAIYQGIARILEDEDLKMRLISNGVESVKRFSLDTMINSLEQLYLE